MYGETKNPMNQEFWDGKHIIGLLEDAFQKHGGKEFKERITAILFLPDYSKDMRGLHVDDYSIDMERLHEAFIVPNYHRSREHLSLFHQAISKQKVFSTATYV